MGTVSRTWWIWSIREGEKERRGDSSQEKFRVGTGSRRAR